MRQTTTSIFVLCGLLMASAASAQSTISDRPFDVVVGSGLWGSLLPSYELGSNTGGGVGPAIRDNMDDVGYYGDLKAIRRFLGTRTSFETRGFYGYSQSNKSSGPASVDLPDPSNGFSNLLSGGSAGLKAKTHHYGIDIGLRDTWRTRFGGLSGGCYFSYMGFDQTFDVDYGGARLISEKLESNYVGGKGFVGWDGCIFGQASTLDFLVGFYDLKADYTASGGGVSAPYSTRLDKTPISIETVFSTYHDFRGFQLGATFGFMYVTMPQIIHNAGEATTLASDRGTSLRLTLELLL